MPPTVSPPHQSRPQYQHWPCHHGLFVNKSKDNRYISALGFDSYEWNRNVHYPPEYKGQQEHNKTPRAVGAGASIWHGSEWSMVALGFAGGTLVLAFVLLFVRMIDLCLKKRHLQPTRPQPHEWQNQVVFATRQQRSHELGSAGEPADFTVRTISAADLPPSYNECIPGAEAETNGAKSPVDWKKDLPTYSDCYVPTHPTGKYSNMYVICNEEAGTTHSKNISNGSRKGGAANSKNILDLCDTIKLSEIVIITGEAGSSHQLVKIDTDTKKTEEKADV